MTLSGFLVVNKHSGISSHSVVGAIRRLTGQKKAGHTGTLDPFATGVLPIALGDATRFIQFLDESRKEYRAVMRLGVSTDTQDYTGNPLKERDWSGVTDPLVRGIAGRFTGELEQIPPMYSAIKRDGVPLYRIARGGGEVDREPRRILINALEMEKIELPDVTFRVSCSRGTYVRTLAHDMGEALGCGAHLVSLERTASGPFAIESAVTLEQLAEVVAAGGLDARLIPSWQVVSHLMAIDLTDAAAQRLRFGISPVRDGVDSGDWPESGQRVMLRHSGELLAAAEGTVSGPLRLLRVFA